MKTTTTTTRLLLVALLVVLGIASVSGWITPSSISSSFSPQTTRRSRPSSLLPRYEHPPADGREESSPDSIPTTTTTKRRSVDALYDGPVNGEFKTTKRSPPPEADVDQDHVNPVTTRRRRRDSGAVWREKIEALAFRTACGFHATPTDRRRMTYLIGRLAETTDPAIATPPTTAFYDDDDVADEDDGETTTTRSSLEGKWTLLYTDAPDILALADGGDAVARVQRIGQHCDPREGTVTNVVEWMPPAWVGALPTALGGTGAERVLQKVVTEATVCPEDPLRVNLVLRGLQVVLAESKDDVNTTQGLVPTLLRRSPLQLQGPFTAPFGSFEILYLDEEIRVVQTDRGYYSINKRNTELDAWF